MAQHDSKDPDATVVVAAVPTELEANLIVEALEERGINSQAIGGMTAGFRAEAPGSVRIIVRRADAARALEAVQAFQREREDIDWSRVDIAEEG